MSLEWVSRVSRKYSILALHCYHSPVMDSPIPVYDMVRCAVASEYPT
jgi:hypothetical protein